MAHVLIIDDEESILAVLTRLLEAKGHTVVSANSYDEAVERLNKEESIELMLSDIRLDKGSGLGLLNEAVKRDPDLPVILITGYASLDTATHAMKHGAFDYLTKPFKIDQLVSTVDRALLYRSAALEDASTAPVRFHLGDIIAESETMQHLCEMVKRVAPTTTPVLICGEHGTDKPRVVKTIHTSSRRSDGPFVTVNCAGPDKKVLSQKLFGNQADKGALLAATGGTLFLDNIHTLEPDVQERLLEALKVAAIAVEGSGTPLEFDTRLITATHADLEAMVEAALFSGDLFNRLSLIPLTVPPLRERTKDIIPLARHRLQELSPNGQGGPILDRDARDILVSYPWPGNDEELAECLEHAASNAQDKQIARDALPERLANFTPSLSHAPKTKDGYRGEALKAFLKEKAGELKVPDLTATLSEQQKETVRQKMTSGPEKERPPVIVPAFLQK